MDTNLDLIDLAEDKMKKKSPELVIDKFIYWLKKNDLIKVQTQLHC